MSTWMQVTAWGVIAAGVAVWMAGPQVQAQLDGGGRYELVNAEYTVTSEGGGAKVVRGLFKLDTQTGRTWRYTEHVRKDGEVRSTWVPAGDRE